MRGDLSRIEALEGKNNAPWLEPENEPSLLLQFARGHQTGQICRGFKMIERSHLASDRPSVWFHCPRLSRRSFADMRETSCGGRIGQ